MVGSGEGQLGSSGSGSGVISGVAPVEEAEFASQVGKIQLHIVVGFIGVVGVDRGGIGGGAAFGKVVVDTGLDRCLLRTIMSTSPAMAAEWYGVVQDMFQPQLDKGDIVVLGADLE